MKMTVRALPVNECDMLEEWQIMDVQGPHTKVSDQNTSQPKNPKSNCTGAPSESPSPQQHSQASKCTFLKRATGLYLAIYTSQVVSLKNEQIPCWSNIRFDVLPLQTYPNRCGFLVISSVCCLESGLNHVQAQVVPLPVMR